MKLYINKIFNYRSQRIQAEVQVLQRLQLSKSCRRHRSNVVPAQIENLQSFDVVEIRRSDLLDHISRNVQDFDMLDWFQCNTRERRDEVFGEVEFLQSNSSLKEVRSWEVLFVLLFGIVIKCSYLKNIAVKAHQSVAGQEYFPDFHESLEGSTVDACNQVIAQIDSLQIRLCTELIWEYVSWKRILLIEICKDSLKWFHTNSVLLQGQNLHRSRSV